MTAHQDVAGLVARLRANPHGSLHIDTRAGLNEPTSMIEEAADRLESLSQALREAEAERDAAKLEVIAAKPLYSRRQLESRLAEAMKVIGFYAEQKNWQSPSSGFALQYDPTPSKIQTDWGEAARAFIAGNGGKDGI